MSAERHRIPGLFVVHGNDDEPHSHDFLATKTYSKTIFGNETVVEASLKNDTTSTSKLFYRSWNPFRSSLAATVMGGIEAFIGVNPNAEQQQQQQQSTTNNVLYLGSHLTSSALYLAEMVLDGSSSNNNSNTSSSSQPSVVLPVVFQNLDTNIRTYSESEFDDIRESFAAADEGRSRMSEWEEKLETDRDKYNNCRNWEMNANDFVQRYFNNNKNNKNENGNVTSSSRQATTATTTTIPVNLEKPIIISETDKEQVHGSKFVNDISNFIETKQQQQQQNLSNNNNSRVGSGNDSSCFFFDVIVVEIFGVDVKFVVENLVAPTAEAFLKRGGLLLLLMDADEEIAAHNNNDRDIASQVYAKGVDLVRQNGFKPMEQLTLEPFFKNKAVLVSSKK